MKFSVRTHLFLISLFILCVVGLSALLYIRIEIEGLRELLPESQAEEVSAHLYRLLGFGALVGLGVALLMSWVSSHLMSRTIHELVETAKGMLKGQLPRHEIMRRKDELGSIARTLRKMADEFDTLVETLTHERDQFRAVLQGMELGVVGLDAQNQITLMNRSARSLLGLREAPIDRAFVEVVREPAVVNLIRNAPSDRSTELEFELGGQPPRMLLARHTPQRTSDGSVLVLQDITEMRRLEEARQDFVANVSHELRTPVAIIHGAAENLVDGALEEVEMAQRFTEVIMRNSNRLSALIGDLLELSQLDSGTKKLHMEPVMLGPLVDMIRGNMASLSEARSVQIELAMDSEIRVQADRGALEQVISNLVDNAIKYGSSPGKIQIRAEQREDAVQIQVLDDGAGIAPSHRTRVFQRFFRVDPGRARQDGGTGLGLAIVKHLVLTMGGKIWLEEASTGGCNFVLELESGS